MTAGLRPVLVMVLLVGSGCARRVAGEYAFVQGQCPEATHAEEATVATGMRKTWCEREDGTKHGPYMAWHPGGAKAAEGAYVEGKEHGTWTLWYPSGQKSQEGAFHHGESHGRWRAWFEDGRKAWVMDFHHGQVVCGDGPLQPACE